MNPNGPISADWIQTAVTPNLSTAKSPTPRHARLNVLIVSNSEDEDDADRLVDELRRQRLVPRHRVVADTVTLGIALDEETWDVLLCDLSFLHFSLHEVVMLVQAKGLDVPVIVVGGTVGEDDAAETMSAGAKDCLEEERWARLGQVVRREMKAADARAERRKAEQQLHVGILESELRARQISCLYRVSHSLQADVPLEQLLDGAVQLIPEGWRYPKIACARVCFDRREYRSESFRATDWKQSSPLVLRGTVRGSLEIYYREERPALHEGPFSKAEQELLDELAGRVTQAIDRVVMAARVAHLNTILRAIRNVNQLIVCSRDPAKLVEQACREIVSARGLRSAWVRLTSQAPGEERAFESGWGDAFLPLADYFSRGHLPSCCHKALEAGGIVTIWDPFCNCVDCPLSSKYEGRGYRPSEALTTALMMNDKLYGFMCVSLAPELAVQDEKHALLREVAGDIAFALYGIEIESERLRAEEAFKKEALRRGVLMNASRDGISIIDQEHRVVEANRRFAEMLGYAPEEVTNLHTWDWEAVLTEAEIRAAFADLTQTNETFETRHRRKDGTTFDVEVSASGARVGNESMVFTVSRDLTEKKNMQASLAQSDRLASMGMLAAGVAHEINNPLSYVLYNLEGLQNEFPRLAEKLRGCREALENHLGSAELGQILGDASDVFAPPAYEDLAQRFREALSGTRRIREIARGLGTFSRVENEQLVPVNLNYTLECAINMAHNEIKYRARLVKEFGTVGRVLASEGRLSQVFLNLLINAAHAIDEGDAEHHEIRLRTWQENEQACVEVRDTGGGIPQANLDRVFEPFFTTKPAGVGAGLGLAISRNIVTGYAGRIEVTSGVGQGTSFVVRLPIRPVNRIEKAPAAEAPAAKIPGRILVIDDEAGVRSAIRRMLREYEVLEAASGEEAKRILASDQRFDLVLCDVMMSAVSGRDLHEWVLGVNPRLAKQFVFITGGAFTPRARAYLAQVDNLCLEKPLEQVFLERVVSELLVKHQGQSEPLTAGS
ncbi:ATP-binding protein [Myxococcota bacterium]